jgi:hypothetical protein
MIVTPAGTPAVLAANSVTATIPDHLHQGAVTHEVID